MRFVCDINTNDSGRDAMNRVCNINITVLGGLKIEN